MFTFSHIHAAVKGMYVKSKKLIADNKKLILLFFIMSVFFIPAVVSAQTVPTTADFGLQYGAQTGLATQDIRVTIARIIQVALGLLGIVAVVIVLYGGFVWMTAGGDMGKVDQAKKILVNGVIGLAIILSAFAITSFVISSLSSATGIGGTGTGRGGQGGGAGGSLSGGALGRMIQSHYPDRDAIDIPRNTKIVVTFNEEIDPTSMYTVQGAVNKLNTDSVKIFKKSDAPVSGGYPTNNNLLISDVNVVSVDNFTFVMSPVVYLGSASENIEYTVYLTNNLKKADGSDVFTPAYGDYYWSFTTNTTVDITPPEVLYISPVDAQGCTTKCVARNKLVQITFDEPIDPTTVTGDTPAFTFIAASYPDSNTNKIVSGNYSVSNQYRTVTFIPSDPCDTTGKIQNSCGEEVYCLPGEKKISVEVKAANLDANAGGAAASLPYTGIVDLAGNSLDGNQNDTAEGPSAGGSCTQLDQNCISGDNCCTDNDNFIWFFNTSNAVDLIPPKIINIVPDLKENNVSYKQNLEVTFNKPLMASSLFGSVTMQYSSNLLPLTDWNGAGSVGLAPAANPQDFGKTLIWNHYNSLLPSNSKEVFSFFATITDVLRDDAQNCFISEASFQAPRPSCERSNQGQFFPNTWKQNLPSGSTFPECDLTK